MPETILNILILEDSATDAELMLHTLRKEGLNVSAHVTMTRQGYVAALNDEIDLILSDYNLPQYDALQALEHLNALGYDIPFILVSGTIGDQRAVEIIRRGATDYLLKSRMPKLGQVVKRALQERHILHEKQQVEEQLHLERDLLHNVIDGLEMQVMITDRDFNIQVLNWQAQKLVPVGQSATEMTCYQLTRGFDSPCSEHGMECPIETALAKNRATKVQQNYQDENGENVSVEKTATLLRNRQDDVTGIFLTCRDISENMRQKEDIAYKEMQLEQILHYDTLTGLPQRDFFFDLLHSHMVGCQKNNRTLALLYLDLDRFKNINDTLGHTVGDQVLQEVAQRLQNNIRITDNLSRMSGDEFLITLDPADNLSEVTQLAQKFLSVISVPMKIEHHRFHLTASIGISLFPGDATSPEKLLSCADSAMYRAKESGRDAFRFYKPHMNEKAQGLLWLETELRLAIEQEQLELHYQPQYDLNTGQLVGMEALVRWNHPEKGMIPPGEFIPQAEETSLIIPLGEWVLNTACRQIAAWHAMGISPIRMAVNISAVQFYRIDLAQMVAKLLDHYGLPATLLELEITESVLMDDVEAAAETMNKLTAMGIQLSIDDFGTGYSSLSYLKRFPISTLKIDRSFINDVTINEQDAAIALSIISLAGHMGIEVLAEGVETVEQLSFLQRHACQYGQGYLFNRPLRAKDIERQLKTAHLPECLQ